jgi:HK97 family phage major capsid protein
MELNEQLQTLQTELKGFIAKQTEEFKSLGTVNTETKTSITELVKRIDAIEVKAARPVGEDSAPPLIEELKSQSDLEGLMKKGRGSVRFELSTKSTHEIIERKNISSAGIGFPTYGVMPAEREAGITWKPRPALRMLDVIPSRPTSLGQIYWVKETVRPTKASPVTEYTGLKPLVEPTFATGSEPVQTIAVLMLASNQVLADYSELEGFLRSEGAARVNQELDAQILSGSGVAPNLNGLVTQSTAFDTSLLIAANGWQYPDVLAAARQQVAEANELEDSPFYVIHPGDAWTIRRLKNSQGNYIFDGPNSAPGPLNLWGAPAVETTQITKGTFLAGSGSPMACEYRNRQNLTIELSTEDSTNFRYNLVTIRFELRGALVAKRPAAFIHGSFTTSP